MVKECCTKTSIERFQSINISDPKVHNHREIILDGQIILLQKKTENYSEPIQSQLPTVSLFSNQKKLLIAVVCSIYVLLLFCADEKGWGDGMRKEKYPYK